MNISVSPRRNLTRPAASVNATWRVGEPGGVAAAPCVG
jgi:hypothetical protein